MKRILPGLVICFCCLNSNAQSVQHDIRFSFTAVRDKSLIIVSATLFNPGSDTVYLLSTSCDGLPYLLNVDTAKFTLSPRLLCNASWPVIEKVPPKGKLDFIAYLTPRKRETELNLGFDLYEIDRTFDIEKARLDFASQKTMPRRIIRTDVFRFD